MKNKPPIVNKSDQKNEGDDYERFVNGIKRYLLGLPPDFSNKYGIMWKGTLYYGKSRKEVIEKGLQSGVIQKPPRKRKK